MFSEKEFMRKCTLLALILLPFLSHATHIVGGEFEFIHIGDNRYTIRMIQYFDVINGNPQARDGFVDASIFRKKDSVFVDMVRLPLISSSRVEYTNPSCSNSNLVTDRIVYETTVELDPDLYDDEQGYYLIWERCCRNNIINNVVNPSETGQTFTLTFPPLMQDGERFINSSPQLFPPLSDYACINQFYYVDFRGFDADGDSLVYSMVTPLNSSKFERVPVPTPGPHPTVNWQPGYSEGIQVQGNPPLGISEDGFLTVTPSSTGLFVFSVLCEEYRNGEKIGEVRRDFQLLVIDCPDPGAKPQIFGKAPGQSSFSSDLEKIVLTPESDKCFEFAVVDALGDEHISIKSISTNFDQDINHLFNDREQFVLDPEDSAKFELCLDECPLKLTEPAVIDIITLDDTCPLPLQDTMRLEIEFRDFNKAPIFVNPSNEVNFVELDEGEELTLPFNTLDQDGDSIDLTLLPSGFSFEDYGITVQEGVDKSGSRSVTLNWDTDCQRYSFADQNVFQVLAIAEDKDDCDIMNPDTVYYNIRVNLPENNPPEIRINGNGEDRQIITRIEEFINLNVEATDPDAGELVSLNAYGVGFDLGELSMEFDSVAGKNAVSTNFTWDNTCGIVDLAKQDTFVVHFIAEDADICQIPSPDTLTVEFRVLPPTNAAPTLTVDGVPLPDTIEIIAGQRLELELMAIDDDGDSLFLQMIDGLPYKSLIEYPVDSINGLGAIREDFVWNTSCDLLQMDFSDSVYTFNYTVTDNKCYVPKGDSITFHIKISDLKEDYDFDPPNAFTPNLIDNWNPAFYIPDLPNDNCFSRFEQIIIYNRWGREVFVSDKRDFQWDGVGLPTGVYYYTLQYTHRTFKGHISLIR